MIMEFIADTYFDRGAKPVGDLIDRSQYEPIQVTTRGRRVAYVICDQDMQARTGLQTRRESASGWYAQ